MIILILACAAQFLVVLDVSIVNVALPSVDAELGLSGAEAQWVVNAYTLAFAGLLLPGGRMADVYGRGRAFATGAVLFSAASLLGGTASSATTLVLARAVQGLGAAVLAPATLTLLTTTFGEGDPRRTRALAIWAAVGMAGGTAGNLLGGVLTEFLSWRWTLLINVPLGVVAVGAALWTLPTDRRDGPRPSFGLPGAVLATSGLATLTLGIVRAGAEGASPGAVAPLVVTGTGLLVLFALGERNLARNPLVPARVLRAGSVARGNVVLLFAGACLTPMWFFLSFSMQEVLGLGPLATGLGFLPHTLLAIVVGVVLTPRLMRRTDARTLVVVGALLAATGFVWQSLLEPGSGYVAGILGPALLIATGSGLLNTPATTLVTAGVPTADAGAASGLMNTTKQLGGALGLAVLVAVAGLPVRDGGGVGGAAVESVSASPHGTAFVLMAGVLVLAAVCAASLPRDERDRALSG